MMNNVIIAFMHRDKSVGRRTHCPLLHEPTGSDDFTCSPKKTRFSHDEANDPRENE